MSLADELPAVPPFTGMALDRASTERKDPDWVARLLEDPAARAVAAGRHGVLLARDGAHGNGGRLLRRMPLPDEGLQQPILLGLDAGVPLFALDLDAAPGADGAGEHSEDDIVALREAGTTLPPAEAGLAAYVAALLNWHRRHRFCANCGAPTEVTEVGYTRHCPGCGADHFPRTDPVVIMTVAHEERLLLGRRSGWPAGRLSVLAGFVSPGESAEEAVVREVREESGIDARTPMFVASQPWPFPASLMLGFHAESDGGEPRPLDGELEEVHWLGIDRVRAAAAEEDPEFKLPPPVSVARFLIDRWLAGYR